MHQSNSSADQLHGQDSVIEELAGDARAGHVGAQRSKFPPWHGQEESGRGIRILGAILDSLFLCYSHSLTLTHFSLTVTHSHSFSFTFMQAHSLLLILTPTHFLIHSHTLALTPAHSLSRKLSHSHSDSFSLTFTHSHPFFKIILTHFHAVSVAHFTQIILFSQILLVLTHSVTFNQITHLHSL